MEVIKNLPFEEYLKIDAISNSDISAFLKSPSYYKWYKSCPDQGEQENLNFGSAYHAMLLEGEEAFYAENIIAPACDRRTKEGKAKYAYFLEESKDKNVMSTEDYLKLTKMLESFGHNQEAVELLNQCEDRELTVVWECLQTGLKLKARFDGVSFENGLVLDLKTTSKINNIANSVYDFGYYRQQIHYSDAFKAITGQMPNFVFAFASTTLELGKYPVELVELDKDFILAGYEEYYQALGALSHCKNTNSFDKIRQISAPKWAFK